MFLNRTKPRYVILINMLVYRSLKGHDRKWKSSMTEFIESSCLVLCILFEKGNTESTETARKIHYIAPSYLSYIGCMLNVYGIHTLNACSKWMCVACTLNTYLLKVYVEHTH